LHSLITSDEWQSTILLQSLRENKTGYRAENTKFTSTDENIKKSPDVFTVFSYPLENVLPCKAMLIRYQ